MKLYDFRLAPNPRRVRIFLAEKGIDVPTVQVDIVKAEHKQPDFLAKNPLAGLPVLELDDGRHLTESVAICRYFEALQPEPPLMGVDALDRAFVEMWNRRMEFEVFGPIAQTFRNTHAFFAGRIPQVAEWGEVNRRAAHKRLAWLDTELAERRFVAGDRFSIADITAWVGIDFGKPSDIRIDAAHKNLQRWYEAVSARPSARA
ncbi:MAG: glutathione S-transferase [Myxococcales bacterium]|nr:glutathione S-transferase [Myxococcales bacterium]MDH5307341.1 glutathione S-transferase [Myxococcales bacterium]MDH5565030.1 glutathione S-transferase [Myxococcales bacterium]